MRTSRRAAVIGAVVVAVAASAMFVSSGSGSGPSLARKAAAPTAKMSVRGTPGITVAYLAANGIVAAGQSAGARGRCPRRTSRPVSGWLASDSTRVVLTDSAPLSGNPKRNRDWGVAVTNLGDNPANYTVGVVCVK